MCSVFPQRDGNYSTIGGIKTANSKRLADSLLKPFVNGSHKINFRGAPVAHRKSKLKSRNDRKSKTKEDLHNLYSANCLTR